MARRKPVNVQSVDYLVGFNFNNGQGVVPFYESITDEQYEKICTTISEGVAVVSAIKRYLIVSDSAIYKSRRYGRDMIEKWQRNEGTTQTEVEVDEGIAIVTHLTDPREAAAMKFEVMISRAQSNKVERLTHRALCNHVEYTGIDGVKRIANIEGARQAMVLLDRIPEASEVEPVEVGEPEKTAPTREELIADLRTLVQTDPDLIAEAGLSVK